jgi:hypothetical protein
VVFHAGVIVPAELTAELAAALEEYLALLPAGRRGGRLSRPVLAVLKASRESAAQHQARQHAVRALAAPTATAPAVLGAGQLASVSESEEITTTKAADLAGYSPEWWRRLAVRGTIRGRQVERKTWLLYRTDVVAYARPMESSTHDDSDQAGTRPQRQAG